MEQYIVSARKYRPSTFKTVVGQKALTATLKNAIDSDRLAQAYLFCGPRGVGKTSCARIFAKTINCLNPAADGEACNECESCKAFNEGRSMNIMELDAASNNSVDGIRTLTDQVRIPPQLGKYRVFIIDEVHMLSVAAFNAFLKTLEEPPKYVIFILATTEKHKIIPTILSRCQIYDFNRITINDMVEQLSYVASQEGITADPAALNIIAQKADGAMRDALSIFDQVAASSRNNITYQSAIANLNVLDYEYYFRLVDAFLAGDVITSLLIYKEVRDHGFDSLFFINGLASHIRDLMVAADARTIPLLEVSSDVAIRYTEQAQKLHPKWCYAAMEHCNSCDLNYRASTNKQFLVELTLIRLCQLISGGTTVATTDTKSVAPVKSTPAQPQAQPMQPQAQPTQTQAQTPTPSAPQQPATPQQATPPPAAPRPTQNVADFTATRTAPKEAPRPSTRQRINLSELMNGTAEQASSSATRELRRKPIMEDVLIDLWFQYIFKNPEQPIAINAMRNAKPIAMGNDTYKVIVENPAQVQALEFVMQDLLEFMRNGLENDMFAISIEVTPNAEKKKILSPREALIDVINNNKVIADGLIKFKAELA